MLNIESLFFNSVSDSCIVPEKAQDVIKHCNDFYSFDEEDRTHLNLPGWQPFSGSVQWGNLSDLCPAPWRYVPSESFQESPSWGLFHVYDGGGYVANLGYTNNTARPIISNLRKFGWIDRQTRAILLQFSIYNANTGYLSIATYYFEILPTGYGNPFSTIDTLVLTSTQTGFYQFYLICQLLFIIMVFLFVLKEIYKIYRMRCAYFRDVWNWVEILQILFSFLVVVFYVIKSKKVLNSAIKVKENPFVSVSFGEAISWTHAENAVSAIAVFIVTVKLLRMIRFNPHISMLMSSFRVSRRLLFSYSIIFTIIFLSYAQFGLLAFGSDIQRYSTFQRMLYSEFLMCLGGKMDLAELKRANRVLGPLFGFSFNMLMAFIFVNFFVAILNDSYEDVKNNTDKQSKEYEMADFILDRLTELVGFKSRSQQKRTDNIYSVEASSDDTELLEETASNINEKASFPTLAIYSNRLRRIARQKQVQNPKLRGGNKTKTNLQKVGFDEEELTGAESSDENLQKENLVVTSMVDLYSLVPEQTFERIEEFTGKIATDDVRQDIELLTLIRFLQRRKDSHVLDLIPETSSTLDDPENISTLDEIEIASSMSASGSSIELIDLEGSSVESGDCYDSETLKHLRSKTSSHPLPPHLTMKELQKRLRSILKQKKTQSARRQTPNQPLFKRYSFL